jgi:hypothetical protein
MKMSIMSAIAAVALSTAAAVPALAHDVIVPRDSFDSALASSQSAARSQAQAGSDSPSAAAVTTGDRDDAPNIAKNTFSFDRWWRAND